MSKRLKSVVCIVMAVLLFVGSVNWQIRNESESKDTAYVSAATENTKTATGADWQVTVPWKEGTGYFDLSAAVSEVQFSKKANSARVHDKNGEGFTVLPVKWDPTKGDPKVDKDYWFKVKDCGRMLVDGKYKKIDAKVYPVATSTLGSAIIFKSTRSEIYLGTGGMYLNDNSTDTYLADGNSWKWSNGYNNELIMLHIQFYIHGAKKETLIDNARGVCYMHDIEGFPGWRSGSSPNVTEGFGVHAEESTIYRLNTSVHNKTTVKVGGVTFSNYYRGNAGSFNQSDTPWNEFTIGAGFSGGDYVDLVYNAAGYYDCKLSTRKNEIKFAIKNTDKVPSYVKKWSDLAPKVEPYLAKYTKVNYKALNKLNEDLVGYEFRGWYTSSKVTQKNYKDHAKDKVSKDFVLSSDMTLYGVYVPKSVTLKVKKVWDANDTGIDVKDRVAKFELRNGSTVLAKATVKGNGTQSVSVEYPDCLNKDKEFVARWYEVGSDNDKFDVSQKSDISNKDMTDEKTQVTTFTNKMPRVDITIKKEWVDNAVPNGVSQVKVNLKRGNTTVKKDIVLSSSNSWTATVKMPQWAGEEKKTTRSCNYSIEEQNPTGNYSVVGYEVSKKLTGSDDKNYTLELKVKNKMGSIKTSCQKEWNDDPSTRPSSIVVTLQSSTSLNGTYSDTGITATLNEGNKWFVERDVDSLNTSNKRLYYKWVEKSVPANYEKSESTTRDGDNFKTTITNSTTGTSLSVRKSWVSSIFGAVGSSPSTPTSVTVSLYRNTTGNLYGGDLVKSIVLNSGNSWSGSVFAPLTNSSGTSYTYYWVESPVKGWTTSVPVSASTSSATVLTNTPQTVSLAVNKVWDKKDSDQATIPQNVVAVLYRTLDGTSNEVGRVTLSSSNNWRGSITTYDKYNSNGTRCTYSWKELEVPTGWVSSVDGDALSSSGQTITNTYDGSSDTMMLDIVKTWEQDIKCWRPSSISFTIKRRRSDSTTWENYAPQIISGCKESDQQTENLRVERWADFANGVEWVYDVEEDPNYTIPDGRFYIYTSSKRVNQAIYMGVPRVSFYITNNANIPTDITVTAEKEWSAYDESYKNSSSGAGVVEYRVERSRDGSTWETVPDTTAVVNTFVTPRYSWTLPRFIDSDTSATLWKYRVRENKMNVSGFTASYIDTSDGSIGSTDHSSEWVTKITNTQDKKTTATLEIQKVWECDEKYIPDAIVVEVVSHIHYRSCIENVVKTVTLRKSEGWHATVSGLAKYNDYGNTPTVYYAREKEPNSLFDVEYKDGGSGSAVSLQYNAESVLSDSTLQKVVSSYEQDSGEMLYAGVIINKEKPAELCSSSVEKKWVDVKSYMDKPSEVSASLYAMWSDKSREKIKTVVLSEDNNWTHIENDLELNKPRSATDPTYIESYQWTEEPGDWENSFTSSSSTVADSGSSGEKQFNTTITNTGIPKTKVTAVKVWDDENNLDGLRPESISVDVYSVSYRHGESHEGTLELSESNGWTATGYYPHMPSSLGSYECRETHTSAGYTSSSSTSWSAVSENEYSYTTTITNTHKIEIPEVSVNFRKVWETDGYYGTFTAPAIEYDIVRIQEGGDDVVVSTQTLPSGQTSKTVSGLPSKIKVDGEYVPVSYECVEKTQVEGFSSSSETNFSGSTYTTVCTNSCPTVKLICDKKWIEYDNTEPNHPNSISLVMSGAGGYSYSVNLLKSANYHAEEDGLPTYSKDGYLWGSWSESNCPEGYKSSIEVNNLGSTIYVTATNVKAAKYVSATVKKVWDDNGNAKGVRPKSIQAQLMRGSTSIKMVTLNDDNNWSYTESDLPATEGVLDEYYFIELPGEWSSNYTSTRSTATDSNSNPSKYTTTITNKLFVPATKSISVEKRWANTRGATPDVDVVAVNAGSGERVSNVITLSPSNGYKATVNNLTKNDIDGREYNYKFIELSEIDDFVVSSEVSGNTTVITNTGDTTYYTDAVVKKEWVGDVEDARPESILVQLYCNGDEPIGSPVTLSAENNWTATENNLVAYHNGDVYTYSWKELDRFEGYTSNVETVVSDSTDHPSTYTTTITNIMGDVPKVTATVEKRWSDGNDEDGIRPESVMVQLYKGNGIAVGSPIILDSSNNFRYTVTDLQRYANIFSGSAIQYYFRELNVPEGYKDAYSTSTSNGNFTTVVTNSYSPIPKTSATVTKVWDDEDNTDGIRPSSVEVSLERSDGTTVEQSIVLSASNNWTKTISGLPQRVDGEAVTYSFVESIVPEEYEVAYRQSGNDTRITNRYDPKRSITVTKKVKKSDVYDPFTLPSFTFQLKGTLSNGSQVEYYQMLTPVEVTSDKDYYVATYTWDSLKKGNYVLKEMSVDKYNLKEITDIVGGVTESETVRINFMTNNRKSGSATFVNELNGYEDYVHTDSGSQTLK